MHKFLPTCLFLLFLSMTDLAVAEESVIDIDDELQWLLVEAEAIRVVTASKLLEALDKAPGSIVVVTKKQIQQRGYANLFDVIKDLPGVDVQQHASGFFPSQVTIRGVSNNNKFLILQDGIRINAATGTSLLPIDQNYPLYYAKQVEILFGPASALYGADAFTGIINIITEEPEDLDGVIVEFEAGEYAYQRAHIYAGKRLSEHFAITIGGQFHDSDNPDIAADYPDLFRLNDLVDSGGNVVVPADQRKGPISDYSSYSTFGKLEFGEDFTLGWYQSEFTQPTSLPFRPDFTDYVGSAVAETFLATLYGQYRFTLNEVISGQVQANYSLYEVDPDSKFVNIFTEYLDGFKYAKGERVQIEPQLDMTWDHHSLIAGLTFERFSAIPFTADLNQAYDPDRPTSGQGLFYPGSNNTLPIKIFDIDYQNTGAFVQWKAQWNENLSTTLGVRYDHSSNYGDTVNPRLGLIYQTLRGTTIKFLYGEAFLAPAPFFQFAHFGSFTGVPNEQGLFESFFFRVINEDLQPEKMKTFELQISHRFMKGFDMALSLYHEIVTDVILGAPTAEPVADFVPGGVIFFTDNFDNIGELEASGADLSFNYSWEGQLSEIDFWGHFSYVDGDLSNDLNQTELFLPFTAKEKFKTGLTYRYRDKYFISPSLRWVGRSAGFVRDPDDPAFGRAVPSYTVVDLYAGIKGIVQGLSINLRVSNLLDKRYFNAGQDLAIGFRSNPQDSRWVRLGLNYRF